MALPARVEERLVALEGDKEHLHLQVCRCSYHPTGLPHLLHSQVSLLSEQINGQTGKIQELEKCLDRKQEDLQKTENMLQIEMLNR